MIRFVFIALIVIAGAVGASAQTGPKTDSHRRTGVVEIGPRSTYLREGLKLDVVLRVLGEPSSVSERQENKVTVRTYVFARGEGRTLTAEFINNVLVHYQTQETGSGNLAIVQ